MDPKLAEERARDAVQRYTAMRKTLLQPPLDDLTELYEVLADIEAELVRPNVMHERTGVCSPPR